MYKNIITEQETFERDNGETTDIYTSFSRKLFVDEKDLRVELS